MKRIASLRVCTVFLTALIAAACGGGGGSNGQEAADRSVSTAPNDLADEPVQSLAEITSQNASVLSELMRTVVYDSVIDLDQLVRSNWENEFPIFTDYPDRKETADCKYGGTVTSTYRYEAAGLSAVSVLQDCVEDAGSSYSGEWLVSLSNVDRATSTFDAIGSRHVVVEGDGFSDAYSGSTFIHTELLRRGEHIHDFSIDTQVTSEDGEAWVHSLTGTVHDVDSELVPGTHDRYEVLDMSGRLGIPRAGYVDIEYNQATSEIHMIGAGGTESFVTLDGDVYAMRYTDPSGETHAISIDASDIDRLKALDGVDAPPEVDPVPQLTVFVGESPTVDLNKYTFEYDFEPVEFSIDMFTVPYRARIDVEQPSPGVLDMKAIDQGEFHFNFTATDPQGNSADGRAIVIVVADSDGDGEIDSLDRDDDNDGVPDNLDALPTDPLDSVDTDADGVGNNADLDDDNDGVPDHRDDYPLDAECVDGTEVLCNTNRLVHFDEAWVDANDVA